MAKSGKSYKALQKRVFLTKNGKKGAKVMRDQLQNRKQRFARATNSKPTNSDGKKMELSKPESKKVKRLII